MKCDVEWISHVMRARLFVAVLRVAEYLLQFAFIKAEIHKQLEQYRLALATYRQADEAFAMAERK